MEHLNNLTKIKTESGEEIGFIKWSLPVFKMDDETDTLTDVKYIKISWLEVNEKFQGKGIASLLIATMLSQINYNGKLEITLDDCSDRSVTKDCIYYKLGFRHFTEMSPPDMSVFINYNPNQPGFTYPDDTDPTPVNLFESVREFLNTFNLKTKTIDYIFTSTKLGPEDKFIGEETDITESIKRRLKTLNLIEYHQRNCNSEPCKTLFGKKRKSFLRILLSDINYLKILI